MATKQRLNYIAIHWLMLATVLLVAGCSEPSATVSGVVLLDGRPLAIGDGMRGTVVFQPAGGEGPMLNGLIGTAGQYQLAAGSNKLVAPGVYLATVSAVKIIPATDADSQTVGRRTTPERYATAADSGLQFTVTPGVNNIKLSLESDADPEEPPQENSSEEPGDKTSEAPNSEGQATE